MLHKIISPIGFTSLILGADAMDSENRLIPAMMMAAGLLMLAWAVRESGLWAEE